MSSLSRGGTAESASRKTSELFRFPTVETNLDGVLNKEQFQILALMELYTNGQVAEDEDETWLRKIPLYVLVYEGIVAKIFDYDYAPCTVFHDKTYIKMNLSQQFNTDLDELVFCGYIRAIKISTRWHTSSLAYQISDTGLGILKQGYAGEKGNPDLEPMSVEELRAESRAAFLTKNGGLWEAEYVTDTGFFMVNKDVLPRMSGVTNCENVSYVSSPWVPPVMVQDLASLAELKSNADRAHECGGKDSEIKDELDELITLNNVHVLVAEYVPFGANQIFALNDKLGSAEKLQGGLFLASIDDAPNATTYMMPHETGLTSVNVTDYSLDKFITFRADIQYENEGDDVVQVEEFGVSARDYGGVFFGMKVEAINDQDSEHISVDLLSRLLVDVADDSSTLLDSLVSAYQTVLLETIFMSSSSARPKYNIIMADSFDLPAKAEKVSLSRFILLLQMDKEYENELKQIIGDTLWTRDLGNNSGLVVGTLGLLYLGETEHVADLLGYYGTLRGISLFLQAFFRRVFMLQDTMATLRKKISTAHTDPDSGLKMRQLHSESEQTVLLLEQVMEFLLEGLNLLRKELDAIDVPEDEDSPRHLMWSSLQLERTIKQMETRLKDMAKNVSSTSFELVQLYNGINSVEQGRSFALSEAVEENTKNLEDANKAGERAGGALEVIQIIMTGNLGFEILDRWDDKSPLQDFDNWGDSQMAPFMWFVLSMTAFILLGVWTKYYQDALGEAAEKVLMLKFKLNKKVHKDKMVQWLATKPLASQSHEKALQDNRKIVWEEEDEARWTKVTNVFGPVTTIPSIVLQYDAKHGYLLQINMTVMKTDGMMSDQELLQGFLDDLNESGVLVAPALTGPRSLPGYVSGSDDEDEGMSAMEIENAKNV